MDSAKSLAVSLNAANIPDEPYFNTLLRIMATRCMMQAVYFCSGMLPEKEFQHYGLATPIYTHFTSPIRRYVLLQCTINLLPIYHLITVHFINLKFFLPVDILTSWYIDS